MRYKRSGFTIVELLIVIVVIAILAGISATAYNGIQKRAGTAAYTSAVDGIEKQIRTAASLGLITAADFGLDGVCLNTPTDLPATDDMPAGACQYVTYQGETDSVSADSTVAAKLTAAGITLPKSLPVVTANDVEGVAGSRLKVRGITAFPYIAENKVELYWYPPDSSSCGRAYNQAAVYENFDVEGMINSIKASPATVTAYVNAYGPDWENYIRNLYSNMFGGAGACGISIDLS